MAAACASTANVTVIIPVRDCEPYLEQCLDSVLGQTLPPQRVICVDDGSTDGSVDLLERYERAHDCVEIVRLSGVGPGVARNVGIERADGEYILFVDADDFIEPELLERACARAKETDADMVVWDVWFYNDRFHHRQYPNEGTFYFGKLDNGTAFSWRANPGWLFLAFQSWAWNKLFRTSFLKQEGIRFDETVARSEDVPFTCTALAAAKRIACVYDRLSNYRVARPNSAMATKDAYPLDFFKAFEHLKEELEHRGVYEALRTAFVSFAFPSCLYNLHTMKSSEAMERVYCFLKDEGFERLAIDAHDAKAWVDAASREELARIERMDFEDYVFYRARRLHAALDDAVAAGDHVAMDLRNDIAQRDGEIMRLGSQIKQRDGVIARLDEDIAALRETLEQRDRTILERERAIEEKESFIEELLGCAEWKVGSALCAAPRAVQRRILARKARQEYEDSDAGASEK